MQSSDRYLRLLERCISVETVRVAPDQRYTMSLNGHCLAEHTFGFRRRNVPKALVDQNSVNTLHDAFFSTPDNRRHEIVMEHRENWTEDHRDKIIATIDELLAQIRSIV
ncbi:unnamed protein product [Cylicostephanus goldi]|uniref:Uncharacterized protein n=2 Tax=Cylicostephanus goldi TaxID=71465 RepID=A0A3P6TFL8_CYLGO|nr:unnamed protein product [Cylicostephanus goldi]